MRPNNPLIQQLRHAETMIELVAKGEFTCTAISGPPGIGKTHLAIKVLNRMGVAHQTIRGSGAGLMLAAYELRAGGIILLDDADNLVVGGGTTQANLVKQLTAPGTTRLISNHTEKASTNAARQNPKDGIAPPEFRSRAGLIWLTNVDLTRGTADPAHMAALADRGMRPIVLSSDRRDIIDYVFDLIVERDLLRKAGASLQQAQEVTDTTSRRCRYACCWTC
jgi:hypothetical protein